MTTMTASSIDLCTPQVAIRELTTGELDEVNGGIIPIIGFAIALGSHIGVGSVTTGITGHLMTSFGLGMATFSMASYFHSRRGGGGGGGGGSISYWLRSGKSK
jgi:lactobin A/cerein 7B family class IIb bacteriocin